MRDNEAQIMKFLSIKEANGQSKYTIKSQQTVLVKLNSFLKGRPFLEATEEEILTFSSEMNKKYAESYVSLTKTVIKTFYRQLYGMNKHEFPPQVVNLSSNCNHKKMHACDVIECSIWSGPQRGIRIGRINRRLHFSQDNRRVIIEIEGEECLVDFAEFPKFWTSCPEIRVARNRSGRNRVKEFIERHDLLPPKKSLRKKGKKDIVYLEVIEPRQKFRLRI